MMAQYVATGIVVAFGTLSAELVDVNHGGEEAEQIETTDQASTNDWKEFISGLKDAGEVTLVLAFDPDATIDDVGTSGTLTIDWPTGATNGFSCDANLSKKGEVSGTLGQKMVESLTFKLTGEPDWADV